LLNAQPMGFYSPSQIVQDARRGRGGRIGLEFLPVDVMHSEWDNTLVGGTPWREPQTEGAQPAIRLGLRQVSGISEANANAIAEARRRSAFLDVADLCLRANLDEKTRSLLAEAGALQALAGNRNNARWIVAGVERQRPLFPGSPVEARVALPEPGAGEEVFSDYRATGLTLGAHPLSLLRGKLQARRLLDSRELQDRRHGSQVHVVGLVTNRQRPQTAGGTMFVTLEDEHGMVNVVVWEQVALRRRQALLGARLLAVRGRWEQVDGVAHLIARDMQDLSELLGGLRTASRDFH
ncbi:MAG: error-prone DNA polymerase, partial [Lysobacteraceae bacterium]